MNVEYEDIPPIVSGFVTAGPMFVAFLAGASYLVAIASSIAVSVPWFVWLSRLAKGGD